MRLTKTSLAAALATASIALGLAPPAVWAGEEDTAKKPAANRTPPTVAASEKDAVVTIGALRVAVDPKTGELRQMTPGEAKKLQDAMRKLFPERVLDAPTVRSDGSLSAVVAPNTLRFSVAHTGPGGRVETECTDSQSEALKFLNGASASKPEEK